MVVIDSNMWIGRRELGGAEHAVRHRIRRTDLWHDRRSAASIFKSV
jgi:hypothetical protein